MDKIYSRRRIIIPKLNISVFRKAKNSYRGQKKSLAKLLKIIIIFSIAILVASKMINAITPIMDKQCQNIAKSIATKISNEQATIVMSKYNYDDLCNIEKDSKRQYISYKCEYCYSK